MKSCALVKDAGGKTPPSAVRLPQMLVLAGALAACSHLGGDQVMYPVVVGMTEATPPAFDDGMNQIYEVHMPVAFPLRAPRANEMNKLKMDPLYPGPVWLESKDFQIELRYTISNLTDKKQVVQLLIDPWNEFFRYKPGITVTEEDAIPDRSGFDHPYVLDPKEKLQGTITNDDTREMAIDLATVMNIQRLVMVPPPVNGMPATDAPNLNGMFNNAFDLQNRSSHPELDPLIAKYIPPLVDGLTGVDIGFRTGSPASIALEVTVDIVDLTSDRVIAPGEEKSKPALMQPTATLSPPAAPAM